MTQESNGVFFLCNSFTITHQNGKMQLNTKVSSDKITE